MIKLFQRRHRNPQNYWTVKDDLLLPNHDGVCGMDILRDNGIEFGIVERNQDYDFNSGIELCECTNSGIEIVNSVDRSICFCFEAPFMMPRYYQSVIGGPWLARLVGIRSDDDSYISRFTSGEVPPKRCTISCQTSFSYKTNWQSKTKFMCAFASIRPNRENAKFGEYTLEPSRRLAIGKAQQRYGARFDFFGTSCDPEIQPNGVVKDGRHFHYSKMDETSKYKFSIDMENSAFDGYISEKIRTSLVSRTIPIYRGAPNIGDFVPKELFINLNDFPSVDDCYDFVDSLSEKAIFEWIGRIDDFVTSPSSYKMTSLSMGDDLVRCIKNIWA